ncbi:DUF3152 domain-containing protein [Streptomyces litchfieldiae]|uniref:DUF3152 domain-containing protein n=1 Tax=Streptomyces litchfieldiae TaxID=3075543 RepID=A0ABU2MN40_9ACTN|nr:DUF3152 domain-containing protein [Streptomyces sp. DSM 44938]MDT0342539.1 DUF3152 domain-containing protein [Streptomyces sp. DSM 44938]
MDHRDTAAPLSPAGPRQEYLDAFDDANYGQHIPEQRGPRPARPASHRRHGRPPKREPVPGDSRSRRAKGGWGRTLTGLAAAAVVTALGVVVAVRVAEPDTGERDIADAERPAVDADEERAERPPADADPSPSAAEEEVEEAAPPTYGEMLSTSFEMDPELTGSGELVPVPGSDDAADPDATTLVRYRVDVEEGIGVDAGFFAEAVHHTLNDERSWGNDGERTFARVSSGDYDFVVTLASPGTAADWCARSGLDITEDNVSCNSSSTERVIINAWRWAEGSETFGEDIAGYRQMLINHEVGHRLGYQHVVCPEEGAPAPVMMQQTKFLDTNGVTCRPNPWPHPAN